MVGISIDERCEESYEVGEKDKAIEAIIAWKRTIKKGTRNSGRPGRNKWCAKIQSVMVMMKY